MESPDTSTPDLRGSAEVPGSPFLSLNLNDTVRFKITPEGWQYIGRVNATDPVYSRYPMRFRIDEDGWSQGQLWSVMQFFGPAISMGRNPPMETTIHVKANAAAQPTLTTTSNAE